MTRHSAANESGKGASSPLRIGTARNTSTVESRATLGPRFWVLLVVWGVIVFLAGLVIFTGRAHAEEVTPRQVDNWIIAYSVERSSPDYLYRDLVRDVRRVVECESHGDLDVINGRRFGARGEVGAGQFMPGPGSIFYRSEAARAGWSMFDPEANVAAAVELIAAGLGPRNWSCWNGY